MDERWYLGLDFLARELAKHANMSGDPSDMTAELLFKLIRATGELPDGEIFDYLVERGVDKDRALRILDIYYAVETGMGLRDSIYWKDNVVEQLVCEKKADAAPGKRRRPVFRRAQAFRRYGEGAT